MSATVHQLPRAPARRPFEDERREVVGALAVEAFVVEDGLTPADRLAVARDGIPGAVILAFPTPETTKPRGGMRGASKAT